MNREETITLESGGALPGPGSSPLDPVGDIAPRLPEFVCGQSADYHSIHETCHHYRQVLNLLDYS